MSETEGVGIGRCVLVLMGGRSGGHRAAVLGAVGVLCFPFLIFFELGNCTDVRFYRHFILCFH
jgi:hypothetical protein